MTPTGPKKSILSPAEACFILEVSARTGVTELKFRDLHVVFGKTAESRHEADMPHGPASPAANDLTATQHLEQSKAALEQDELRVRQDRLAMALVEDPALYEELLVNEELDASDESDDDDT